MPKKSNMVYQFKITLYETNPVIWRRIQVSEDFNFWDLHVAFQDSMGWQDCHLHCFVFKRKHSGKVTEIGIPLDDESAGVILPGWEIKISKYFDEIGGRAQYNYDFGDNW